MNEELDRLLKQGRIKEVQSHLEKVEPSKVPRGEALGLANVARRAGFHRLAFKILNPVARPKNKLEKIKPSAEELAEYGMILFRLGVMKEARKILNSPGAKDCPNHLLYLAFTYFAEWDYEKARELLDAYGKTPGLDVYSQLLGKVNLAQSHVGLDQPEPAIQLAKEVIAEAKKHNLKLILANALQNLADAYVDAKTYDKIHEPLNELKKLIGESHYRYNLYVKRALACAQLPDVTLIRELGIEAKQKRSHELARECDLIEAITTRNEELFKKVYFGTPYVQYRQRMLKYWGKPIDLGKTFLWDLNSEKKSERVFDVGDGRDETTKKEIKKGTAVHRLLKIFASNMYQTFKTEAIFCLLFPDEHLEVASSANKVYDTVARARRWLETEQIGLSINEVHNEYFLASTAGIQLRLPIDPLASNDVGDEHVLRLKDTVGPGVFFTLAEVREILNVSRSTANRILQEATMRGEVKAFGKGRATKYKFLKAA
jgi:hypothetical protein